MGTLVKLSGLILEATGISAPIGGLCLVGTPPNAVEAEVVGFSGDRLFLMPTSDVYGLEPGTPISLLETPTDLSKYGRQVPVGPELLGRVVDGLGRPLDRLGPLDNRETYPLHAKPINPLSRASVREPLDVGVRAINALLTVGRGQRLGLFAGSGVGKSVLLGMMARYTTADVIVVGLIGERGREVRDFIDNILGKAGLQRAVVVAAPADASPLLRLHGAAYATSVAEYFRDQGKNVLLIMDSLTRYAMAQREIALAIGEPPATKGYPPSVFAKLPQLVERAGNAGEGEGSITAFYTVLTEGDDQQDPIADNARAILDGHIVLSRERAEQGHYPAIDMEASISRAMQEVLTKEEQSRARQFKSLYSRYQRNRDLLRVGAYVSGSDPLLDQAIIRMPDLDAFLQQDHHEALEYGASHVQLAQVLN